MRNLILLLFVPIFFNACGQTEVVVFDAKFQPNSEYKIEMETISKSLINFTGPSEKINKIKESGIELPMIVEGSTTMTSTTRTFDLESDSTFKAIMTYDNVRSYQVQNGERTEKESPISGMLIEGTYNTLNKFKIDTIISAKIDDSLRRTLIHTLENIQEQISFPDYPMRVGDTFEQELPMNIPVSGISNVGIIIKTNYKLQDIRANLATFDINQTIELNMEIDQANVSASGEGTGLSQFDISKKFITKYESDLIIKLILEVEDLKVDAEINSKSFQNVIIK